MQVKDIAVGSGGSNPRSLVNVNGTLFFVAQTDTQGAELWRLNTSPTDITLSTTSIAEGNAANATIGTLGAADPDSNSTFTFAFIAGPGSTDNGSFTITGGNTLKITPVADFETKNSYAIRLQVTDQGGLTFQKQFTITVIDQNDAPTDITLSLTSILENNVANATIGTLGAADINVGNTFTFTFVGGAGSADNGSFSIAGGNILKITPVSDFETKNSYFIRLQVADQGGLTFDKQFTISIIDVNEAPDSTPPTVTLASGATDPTGLTPFTVNVTFSENVNGFILTDLAVAGGTASSFTGSGAFYAFTVTPSGLTSTVTVNVPANVAADAAGNPNTASAQFTRTIDIVKPTVSITSTSTNPTGLSAVPVTVTFSEVVTGFVLADLVVANGTISAFAGSGTTYTFNLALTGPAATTVNILDGAAVDAFNNLSTAAATFTRLVDVTAPTVGIGSTTVSPTNVTSLPITVTFSETVTGFDQSDLAVVGGTIFGFSGSGASYAFNITPAGTGLVTVNIPANAATDAADNKSAAATQFSRTVDQTVPTVSISSSAANPTNLNPIPVTVTFSESVTGFSAADLVVTGGTVGGFSGSGATYSFNVAPTGTGSVTVDIPANAATDAAGNGSLAAVPFSRAIDGVSPSVVSLAPVVSSPSNVKQADYIVTFSEAVTGVTADDFKTVLNGVNTTQTLGLTGTGASYVVTVLNISGNGTVGINLIDNLSILDAAGNTLLKTNGSGNVTGQVLTIDQLAPTVVISSTTGNPTTISPIPVTVTFSEAVTGFVQADLAVALGTVSDFSGSGSTYKFNVTPTSPGVVMVDIPANAATDAVGNSNPVAAQFSRLFRVAPQAGDGVLSTDEDTPKKGLLVVTDADSPPAQLTISLVANPAHGKVQITDVHTGAYTYTPEDNFHGPDSFTFQASDGGQSSNIATVSITVAPVNDLATISGPATGSLIEDHSTFKVAGTLTVADVDTDENAFQSPNVLDAIFGAFTFDPKTGDWTYSLDNGRAATNALINGQNSTDTLTVTARDGTATRMIVVTVIGINDSPVITLNTQPLKYSVKSKKVVAVDGSTVIADSDSQLLSFNDAVLTVSGQTSRDTLSIIKQGGIKLRSNTILYGKSEIGKFSGGAKGKPLTIILKSGTTSQVIQSLHALLTSIGFKSTEKKVPATRTITMQITKLGGQTTNLAERKIEIGR